MSEIEQMINEFIVYLDEPYKDVENLNDVRCAEVDEAYLKPLERTLRNGSAKVKECLAIMKTAIVDYITANGEDDTLRRWKRCCRGIADYLLRPRLQASGDRNIAAGVVVRLSGYVTTSTTFFVPFRQAAEKLSTNLWTQMIPYLKTGGDTEIALDAPDPLTIWRLVEGHTKRRTYNEKRTLASRFINYLAYRGISDAEVDEADYNEVQAHFGISTASTLGRTTWP